MYILANQCIEYSTIGSMYDLIVDVRIWPSLLLLRADNMFEAALKTTFGSKKLKKDIDIYVGLLWHEVQIVWMVEIG